MSRRYYAYTCSNAAAVKNVEEAETILDEVQEFVTPTPRLTEDGEILIEGETTLDYEGYSPEEFLVHIQPLLEEPLVVRLVGYWNVHDAHDLPDAVQWVVPADTDENVKVQHFPDPTHSDDLALTPAESDPVEIADHLIKTLEEQGHRIEVSGEKAVALFKELSLEPKN